MEERLLASARATQREKELDPDLLVAFRAAKGARPSSAGGGRAHTVGRSDPSAIRPRVSLGSFDDLTLLGAKASEDVRVMLEKSAGALDRNVLDAFIAAVLDRPSHRGIPALATICSSRPAALAIKRPTLADVFAPPPAEGDVPP